ncbi:retrotransposon gag protein [Trifolium pratense]|uniref:Retrotransposon gag protein n=1 Tax=Trifolium pratense TaxID=57577 RepID=A0A2K3LKR1_TRIPR|nr:retrotransposon gag protein [Trifolium pratense]
MEARVEALEGEISVVRSTLTDVQNTVKENHASLVAMLERCMGKSVVIDKGSASVVVRTTPGIPVASEKKISDGSRVDAMTEFHQSVKKMELPSFDGEDPVWWISGAEMCFRIQGMSPEVKVSLAQICMEDRAPVPGNGTRTVLPWYNCRT